MKTKLLLLTTLLTITTAFSALAQPYTNYISISPDTLELIATNDVVKPPVKLQWDWLRATNVVIDLDYAGTIQIGTNFYTRKDFEDLAVIPKGNFEIWKDHKFQMEVAKAKGRLSAYRDVANGTVRIEVNPTNTEWLQSPITVRAVRTGPQSYEMESVVKSWAEPGYRIGLRADGVVVWKERE